ncbi:MAG: acyl-CoA desaturase [Acidimicrobiales bacterium]
MSAMTAEAPACYVRTVEAHNSVAVSGHGTWRLGVPFILVHLSCLAVLIVGWSPVAIVVCVLSYLIRMFGITAFYHRCFSHRAFRVTRPVQLIGACLGASAAQRGPLWWVSHHRRHHQRTDRIGDPHSPVIDGLATSHVLWMFAPANRATDPQVVPDLAAYRELRLLDRFHHVMPALYAAGMFGLGSILQVLWPGLHTSGLQMLVFGFSISTVLLYHATFAVNSLGHTTGSRKFETRDRSRNNWWLAVLTLGEGWHNNHHRFPYAARAGLAVWEADMTWVALRLMASLRLVRDLRPVPLTLKAGSASPASAHGAERV